METLLKPETFNLTQFEEKIFEKKPSGDVMVFVLLPQENPFCQKEICGKKTEEWVKLSVAGFPVKELIFNEGNEIVSFIKPYLTSHKTTVVLYGDTPLFTKKMMDELLTYFSSRQMNVLKTKRGVVFDTEFLRDAEKMESSENSLFCGDEFLAVKNAKSFNFVSEKIRQRIVDFHIAEGVEIFDRNTTFIDAFVVIEKGVQIEPLNVLKGNTIVCANVVLKSGNVVENCVLEEGCVLTHCVVTGVRVKKFSKHTFEKMEG